MAKTETITIRCTPELRKILKQEAESKKWSISFLASEWLAEMGKRRKKKELVS